MDSTAFHRSLYNIAMSIDTSLDLESMLSQTMGLLVEETASDGGSVLLFDDSIEEKINRREIFSYKGGPDKYREFYDALKSVGFLEYSRELKSFENSFPICDVISAGERTICYHIFLLPGVGILILFKDDSLLEPQLVELLVPVFFRLSLACFACLQKRELEMLSESTDLINRELLKSESSLKQTIKKMSQTRDKLLAQKSDLALILQSLGEGVIVVDRNRKINLMNTRAMEYLDYIPADNEPISYEAPFVNCRESVSLFKTFFDDDALDDSLLELRVEGVQGKERVLELRKSNIKDVLSTTPDTILLLHDVTREKEADRMKDQFVSNLSHELRTPMNAILGISKMLMKKNNDNLNQRQIEGLDLIYGSGKRLLSLINNLLDLSKIEAGMMELVNETFSLSDVIGNIDGYVKALIAEKPIVFHSHISRSVPDRIISDTHRLQQVLMNLLGNSVKYTPSGEIHLNVYQKEGRLSFECRDTGIGIGPDTLPHIFERFKQADGSTSRKYGGTGLGLALTKDLVTLLGGEITAESREGEGTTITFTLPLSSVSDDDCLMAADPSEEDSPVCTEKEEKSRILIVDDEKIGRDTLGMLLDQEYVCMFAESGKDALTILGEEVPDVILLDLLMPEMDGYATLQIIRSIPECRSVPVIAVTALAMKGDREAILEKGFDAYLSKPIDDEQLKRIIETSIHYRDIP